MAVKLLDCPFCGAGGVIEADGAAAFSPACFSCHAQIAFWFPNRDQAAAAWNRRAISGLADPSVVQDMLDALRQWARAEAESDELEIANARVARDLAIAKAEGRL